MQNYNPFFFGLGYGIIIVLVIYFLVRISHYLKYFGTALPRLMIKAIWGTLIKKNKKL
jgi:hypothetical protein